MVPSICLSSLNLSMSISHLKITLGAQERCKASRNLKTFVMSVFYISSSRQLCAIFSARAFFVNNLMCF